MLKGLGFSQLVHEATERDQFLMKLRSEFEGNRSNLMNQEPMSFLDACLTKGFHEEQWLLAQITMEQHKLPSVSMAYAIQGKPKSKYMSNARAFVAKSLATTFPTTQNISTTIAKGMDIPSRMPNLTP